MGSAVQGERMVWYPLGRLVCGTALGYIIKAHKLIFTPTVRFRWTVAGVGAQIMLSPDSTQAFHHGKAIKGPSPQAQRSLAMHSGRQDPILRIHTGWTNTLSRPLPGLSRESHQPCWPGLKLIKSSGATLRITCQTKHGMSKGVGHIMECRGREVHGCRELLMGYLGEEQKAGKGRGLGDLGKNKWRKMKS